ncbi:MAG: sigma-70 family RNA polymerase sigma factor [Ferruginibacter sp.]|nr:sigma-70 family RNA polymerase sigma factor [Cytophagales bacterium]
MDVVKSFSDADLVTAIKTGNGIDHAIGFIYRTHYRLLESFVLANRGDAMDAEDLIQEVLVIFVEMVQKDKYRGEAGVKSFLYSLTHNLWISELRKRSSTAKRNALFENNRETVEKDVAGYLMYKEAQKKVIELLGGLGEKCKQILTLFYYENLPMKEILKQTSYENEQVLRNKKYRCLQQLTTTMRQSPAIFDDLRNLLQYAN